MKASVIGGGIHGLTSAIALAKEGLEVTIFEKEKEILLGTSGSTHNRAHMGYHYPRSCETAIECSGDWISLLKNIQKYYSILKIIII